MSQSANSSAEVHTFPRRQSPNAYEQARQELAAFNFSLFETVAADPLLRAGQCLDLVIDHDISCTSVRFYRGMDRFDRS